MRRKLLHGAEYAALSAVVCVLRALPHRAALAVGAALGEVAYRWLRVRRRVVESNLMAALGLAPGSREMTTIASGCYRNLGLSLVELARLPVLARKGLGELVSVHGLEHLDRALASGRGAVLAAAHFGNWELMGAAVAQLGYPVNFLVGHQSNRLVDARLNSIRTRCGIGLVRHGAHVRQALRLLRRNELVAMLCDHDAGRRGITVEFFGMPASAAPGPAALAHLCRCPIIVAFIERSPDRQHRVELCPPIFVPRDTEPRSAIVETTQRLARIVEERVRRRPDHWYWIHRRWKTGSGALSRRAIPAPGLAPSARFQSLPRPAVSQNTPDN